MLPVIVINSSIISKDTIPAIIGNYSSMEYSTALGSLHLPTAYALRRGPSLVACAHSLLFFSIHSAMRGVVHVADVSASGCKSN